MTEAVQSGIAATLGLDLGLFFAQLFNFSLLLIVLWKLAWKPLLAVMEQRRQAIEMGLQQAEQARIELESAKKKSESLVQKARREAREVLSESQQEIGRQHTELSASFHADLDRQIGEARVQLERERQQMVASAKQEIADVIILATEKVSGSIVPIKMQAQYVRDAIEEIES